MDGFKAQGSTIETTRSEHHVLDAHQASLAADTLSGAASAVPSGSLEDSDIVTSRPADQQFALNEAASTAAELGSLEASAATTLSPRTLRRRLAFADAFALAVGIAIGFVAQRIFSGASRSTITDQLILIAASVPVFAMAASYNKLYQARANTRRLEEAMNIFKAVATGMAALLLIALAIQNRDLSRVWVAATAIGIAGAVLLERRTARSMFTRLRQQGRMTRRIIMVGTDAHAVNLVEAYRSNPALGYQVVGFVGDDEFSSTLPIGVLGAADEVHGLLDDHNAVGVVVSLSSVPPHTVNQLTRQLTDSGYHVALSSSLRDIDVTRLRPQTQDGQTMIYVEPTVRGGWRAVAKRVFDLALATFILILSLPLQLATAIAIVATSRGPIFFRQIRVGQDGELFEVLKFRTMYEDAEARKAELMDQNEADGPLFKMRNDPRVTSVGRIIRKLSIDELPQLFCVLLGSMSMVGPRPALPSEVEQWDDQVRERLRVPPGLTGMWQVSGRSDSSFEVYKRMDLYYVDNWSLLHDIKICFRTVGVVLRGSGAS